MYSAPQSQILVDTANLHARPVMTGDDDMRWPELRDLDELETQNRPVGSTILGGPLVLAPDLRGPVRNLLTGHLSTS